MKIHMTDLSWQDQIGSQKAQLNELDGSIDQDITEDDQLAEK